MLDHLNALSDRLPRQPVEVAALTAAILDQRAMTWDWTVYNKQFHSLSSSPELSQKLWPVKDLSGRNELRAKIVS